MGIGQLSSVRQKEVASVGFMIQDTEIPSPSMDASFFTFDSKQGG